MNILMPSYSLSLSRCLSYVRINSAPDATAHSRIRLSSGSAGTAFSRMAGSVKVEKAMMFHTSSGNLSANCGKSLLIILLYSCRIAIDV